MRYKEANTLDNFLLHPVLAKGAFFCYFGAGLTLALIPGEPGLEAGEVSKH